jgi:SAM-dependent methyltransferase
MMMRQTTSTTSLLLLLSSLLLLAAQNHYHPVVVTAAHQSSPLASGAAVPSTLAQDGRCVDGSCLDDDILTDDDDDDDEEEDSSDDDDDDAFVASEEEENWLLEHNEHHDDQQHLLDELYSFLTSSTTLPLKTIERTLLTSTHPTALQTTLSLSGNYTDGSIAGSSQWVGRTINAQIATSPTYTTCGSILDVTTSGSRGGRQDTIMWLSSVLHRNQLVQYHGEIQNDSEEYIKPCRVDLLDDNDEDARKTCVLGVELEEFVSVVSDDGSFIHRDNNSNNVEEEIMEGDENSHKLSWALERAREKGLLDDNTILPSDKQEFVSTLNQVPKGRKFDTIIINGLPIHNNHEVLDLKLDKLIQNHLKPGGIVYVFGEGPLINTNVDEIDIMMNSNRNYGPGEQVFGEILDLLDSVKSVSLCEEKEFGFFVLFLALDL